MSAASSQRAAYSSVSTTVTPGSASNTHVIRSSSSQRAVDQAIAAQRQAQARLGVKDGETFDIETFSQVKSNKANLDLAEKELQRAERLFASGDVSRSILDQRRSQRDALLGQLDEARSNAAVAVKAINSAEAAVAAARSAVSTARTQVEQAAKGRLRHRRSTHRSAAT